MKEKKKYIIKESELKEIIKEMFLMELFDPNDYKDMYTQNYKGRVPNIGDALKGVGNIATGWIPDEWKEKVAQSPNTWYNDVAKWLLGATHLNAPGTGRPDVIPNWLRGQRSSEGQDPNAQTPLSVSRACYYLQTHAYPEYDKRTCGNCARAIRNALVYGGLNSPWGNPSGLGDAKNYIRLLPANGWQQIPQQQAGEPGDILVINEIPGHKHGHIAMCLGNGRWAADYMHKTWHGLASPPPAGSYFFFRYKNRVE